MAEILSIFVNQRGEWTAEELSEWTGAPYPTVTREVRRLERSGVLVTSVTGRTKLLSLDTADPAVRALVRAISLSPSIGKEGDMAKKKDKKDKKKDKMGKKK